MGALRTDEYKSEEKRKPVRRGRIIIGQLRLLAAECLHDDGGAMWLTCWVPLLYGSLSEATDRIYLGVN